MNQNNLTPPTSELLLLNAFESNSHLKTKLKHLPIDCQESICLNEFDQNNNKTTTTTTTTNLDLHFKNHFKLDNLDNLIDLKNLLKKTKLDSSLSSSFGNHLDQFKMSTTTETSTKTATTTTTNDSNNSKVSLKPIAAKRTSLDANTVPARRSTSGVYQLIKPKRTSLDLSSNSNSLLTKNSSSIDKSSSPTPSSSSLDKSSFDKNENKINLRTISSSKSELSSSTKKSLDNLSEEELNCAFQLLDVNSDGSISKQELKEMLSSLNIQADDHLIKYIFNGKLFYFF